MLNATDVMPNYLQRFAVEGMQMVNAFVGSPKCCPSRTSLLSGRFTHSLNDTLQGWCGNFISEDDEDATFIKDVSAAGYTTGLFGKIVNEMGPMCSAAARVPAGFNLAEGDAFVAMCNEVVYYKNTFNLNGKLFTTGDAPSDYLMSFLGNKTMPWLTKAAQAAASGGKPFFAYLAPHAPHFPAEPAPWYQSAPLPSDVAPRLPSYNASTDGKSWALQANPSFNAFTEAGIDLHFRNRQRSLMSFDDYVRDIFATLEAAGVLENTYVFATSDHGYHLGEFRIPFEKSTMYDFDVRVPFYVRGPGVPAGGRGEGMVSLMDVGATVMELAGARAPGARTTDGRSIVPILSAPGAPPAGWRNGLLIEHLGEANQWMSICGWVFNASCTPEPKPAKDPFYLIDGPQNTWSMYRVVNSTHNFAYTEYRPRGTVPSPNFTNFTELYDLAADFWQTENLAPSTPTAAYAAELWAVASCTLSECP
jgi:N-acetylglucosamine-6-sulfatase